MTTAARMIRSSFRPTMLGVLGLLVIAFLSAAQSWKGDQGPILPPGCEALAPPAGNVVSFHGYATGVQIYTWNATTNAWVFVAPSAKLFADAGHHGLIASHYAGPTWQSNSGSTVVGSAIANCTPDPTAIKWLLLTAVTTQGPGPLEGTTYIQRVYTVGGLAPATPGTAGQTAEVPYTAEYYFYNQG